LTIQRQSQIPQTWVQGYYQVDQQKEGDCSPSRYVFKNPHGVN
jgi:hypothetical protein